MHALPTPSLLPVLVILRNDDNRPAHLALMGLRPMVVHSVESALRVLAERSFAAVVVDLELPQQDTLSFVSSVRDYPQTAEIPILALGCRSATCRAMAKDRGVDVVLSEECSKPRVFADEVGRALLPPEAGVEAEARDEAEARLDFGDCDLDTLEVAMPFGLPADSAVGALEEENESGIFERNDDDAVTRVARPSRIRRFSKPRQTDGAPLDPFSRSFAANQI